MCDYVFKVKATRSRRETHKLLRRTLGVIEGTIVCDVRVVPAKHVDERRKWRPCPCGERAKNQEPQNREYITICSVCMGV